ncbi:hypothetical protein V4F39_00535 [Aquincola sp. MAHUQ-54]|uniref:Uncharacterized protein n=1 Tax=Aquincola agrisoli TaxID=3119538 RepID=A0AAW9PXA4_9BURK
MQVVGISLRKPGFNEITAATVMGGGLWIALVGLLSAGGHALERPEAAALLLVMLWGSLSVRLGIDFAAGWRHRIVHLAVCGLLLGACQAARMLFG